MRRPTVDNRPNIAAEKIVRIQPPEGEGDEALSVGQSDKLGWRAYLHQPVPRSPVVAFILLLLQAVGYISATARRVLAASTDRKPVPSNTSIVGRMM